MPSNFFKNLLKEIKTHRTVSAEIVTASVTQHCRHCLVLRQMTEGDQGLQLVCDPVKIFSSWLATWPFQLPFPSFLCERDDIEIIRQWQLPPADSIRKSKSTAVMVVGEITAGREGPIQQTVAHV